MLTFLLRLDKILGGQKSLNKDLLQGAPYAIEPDLQNHLNYFNGLWAWLSGLAITNHVTNPSSNEQTTVNLGNFLLQGGLSLSCMSGLFSKISLRLKNKGRLLIFRSFFRYLCPDIQPRNKLVLSSSVSCPLCSEIF